MAEDKNSVSKTLLWVSVNTLFNMLLLFILVESFFAAYSFSYKLFADMPCEAISGTLTDITINEGMTIRELASVLESNHIVESEEMFLARVYIGKYSDRIKSGTYSLSPTMTPDEICKTICREQSEGEQ